MSKLEIDNVSMSFAGIRAVNGVSLRVEEGETVVLLGSSGCGKTTLLRLIAGFLRPTSGAIRVNGKVVASEAIMVPPERRSLSMVFQSYAIWPHKTVAENLSYGLRLRGLDKITTAEKVRVALATVQMDAYADRYSAELSGGQQQRVALARALVLEPEILLFDEPLSNLDAALREHMRFEIKALLTKLKITSIYVTHDQNEAMVVADRIAVMNNGRIEQVGSAEDVYYRSETDFVAKFIGLANVFDAEVLGPADNNCIRLRTPGLGDVLATSGNRHFKDGSAVKLYIRPENIRISPQAGSGENHRRGQVMRRSFLGAQLDLLIDVGGTALRVVGPSAAGERHVDASTFLSFDPADCLVLTTNQ
ncbi:ABC transporter ATP-binding protein [Microvirga antarctica]|uniref:ABC transporter ATP-binding protein n=1 Tax=Microvirga antarctica TaxID=2819233 RepID=UPI001B310697|nr:ABC transporter ATP-binding protein [Microvirga antarctica]